MRIKKQSFKIEHKQDEVNYAVSEKGRWGYGCEIVNEDDGLYWDVLVCN